MKSLISYFIVLFSAFVYMILFDAPSGAVMLFFLVISFGFSLFFTLRVRKKLSFSIQTDEEDAVKGKKVNACISVIKESVLPTPVITLFVHTSSGIRELEYRQYRFSMSENKKLDIDLDIVPVVSGPSEVFIDKAVISDYLGIFRFKIRNFSGDSKKIFTSPEIPLIENGSEMMKMIYDSVSESDDELSDTSLMISGVPGYEYREYVPGDSLKKINWKLSTKRNQLFVRLDEASGVNLPFIVIDNSCSTDNEEISVLLMRDRIKECALAVMMACVSCGVKCNFSYFENGMIVTKEMNAPEDVEKAAHDLSKLDFGSFAPAFSDDTKKKSSSMFIVFTLNDHEKNSDFYNDIVSSGNSLRCVIPEELSSSGSFGDDVWLIQDDYTMTSLA